MSLLPSLVHFQPLTAPVSSPLFVTWNKVDQYGCHQLRGCIGTFDPRPLHAGLREYALTSAVRDRRFPPVQGAELRQLMCTVSLLHSFELADTWDDWTVGTHGIIIEFSDPIKTSISHTATFLPDVASQEGWDKAETLKHLIRKAGYMTGGLHHVLNVLKVTRYESTTCTLSYDEMQTHSTLVRGGVHATAQTGIAKASRKSKLVPPVSA